jgi:GNAT superfamily N-acetyltransferase
VLIRDASPDDLPFLREMLYTAALWRPDGDRPPLEFALAHPQLVIYHQGWGRSGDTGLVAEVDGEPVGAVFYRLFTQAEHGHGYMDDETPEIAIAVREGHRGQGIGAALLTAIADRACRDGIKRLALSVDPDNPAKRLYERSGYVDHIPEDEHHRMLFDLA